MSEHSSDPVDLIQSVASATPPIAGPEDGRLALVAREGGFQDRYRVWRGRSGRRYLVTVMPLAEAMRAENGVVLLVAIDRDNRRQIVWAGESGDAIPGIELSAGMRLEAHVHLLASGSARKSGVLEDLVSGTQGYSSVLTVRAAASQDSVGSTTPSRSSSLAVFRT